MTTVRDMPEAGVIETAKSTDDERKAALERAVADLTAHGRRVESKPDYQAVLVGHNEFRVALVRRQWGIRPRRELVEVDKRGDISIRQV
jgi:hypothetical protein